MEKQVVRVRFAPSPTGYLHIGSARTALFNWLYAKQTGGKFILRIEDTDIKRSTQEAVKAILEGMKWLRLDWDEGPYFQSERLKIYQKYAFQLLEAGYAYYCYCTAEELKEKRERMTLVTQDAVYNGNCRELSRTQIEQLEKIGRKPSIRFKVPTGTTRMDDLLRGSREFDNQLLGDFIIIRSDGNPTYNFAVAVDDFEMGITHVIRGDDHLSNTPRQILLFETLGFDLPCFVHLPMIWGPDKTRLSKRHGSTSVTEYQMQGFLQETIINYLALLGWGTSDSQQIFSIDELIAKFSISRINKNPSIFDLDKLKWMNSEYIKNLTVNELVKRQRDWLLLTGISDKAISTLSMDEFREVVKLSQPRIKTLADFNWQADFFWANEVIYEQEALEQILKKPETAQLLLTTKDRLSKIIPFKADSIEKCIRGLAEELDIKAGEIIHPLRVALTGRKVSPGIFEVTEVLGKEKTLSRIDKAITTILI